MSSGTVWNGAPRAYVHNLTGETPPPMPTEPVTRRQAERYYENVARASLSTTATPRPNRMDPKPHEQISIEGTPTPQQERVCDSAYTINGRKYVCGQDLDRHLELHGSDTTAWSDEDLQWMAKQTEPVKPVFDFDEYWYDTNPGTEE